MRDKSQARGPWSGPGFRSQYQWSYVHHCSSRVPCKHARPRGHKWEFVQPTLFSASPMPRGMGICYLFGSLGRTPFNLSKSTMHAGS